MATPFTRLPASWAVVVVALVGSIVLPLLAGGSSLTQLRLLCAVVPALVVLHLFIKSDLFPEPAHLILVTFVLGVVVTLPVAFVAAILDRLVGGFGTWGPIGSPPLKAFVAAALPEETAKFLILTAYCAKRSAFDEPMDGLVYGVTASLGFAALENISYVFHEPDYPRWFAVASIRAVSAVPSHGVDGAVMGFFIGLRHAIPARRTQLTRAAWGVPVVMHGLYDLGAFIGIPVLWFAVFVVQVGMAKRMLAKLQAIQVAKEHPEAVVQWAWIEARRYLRLKPRPLPLPAAAVLPSAAEEAGTGSTAVPASGSAAIEIPLSATCPQCNVLLTACVCSTRR
jgi:RsiW-degrading membrane proteinase PrsW (M82 family)